MSFGASAPGISTAPITRSASATDSSICRLDDISEADAAGEDLLEVAHPVDRALEDRHVRAEAERDHRGVVADDPAADHDAPCPARRPATPPSRRPRPPSGFSRKYAPACAREAAGDLAHRREQRQRAVVGLDGLVGDGGDAAVDERARERLVGGEVEVREEDEPLAQPRVLRLRSAPSP